LSDVVADAAQTFLISGSGDVIELHDYGISSFAQLQPFMTQIGADTLIALDDQNHILLQHVTLSALNSGDFIFSEPAALRSM